LKRERERERERIWSFDLVYVITETRERGSEISLMFG
jgi:hypothetical protein